MNLVLIIRYMINISTSNKDNYNTSLYINDIEWNICTSSLDS